MKKLVIFLAAVAVAVSASASVNSHPDGAKGPYKIARADFKFKKGDMELLKHHRKSSVGLRQAASVPTVITERPEGVLYSCRRSGTCLSTSSYGVSFDSLDGLMEVVINSDNQVYIHNPIEHYSNYDSWVEGTIDVETGLITIPTGQYLFYDEENEYGIQLMWGSTDFVQGVDEDGKVVYSITDELDEQASEIYYQLEGDRICLLGSEGDMYAGYPMNYCATGLCAYYDNDSCWAGVLEFGVVAIILNLAPAIPADPVVDYWYDCGNESGYSSFNFILPATDVEGNNLDPTLLSYSIYTDNDQLFTFEQEVYSYNLQEDMTEIPYSVYSNGYDFYRNRVYFYRTNREDQGYDYERFFYWRIGIQVHYTFDGVKNSSNIVYLEVFDNPFVTPGDLNMDGSVTIEDVAALIDYLLGNEVEGVSEIAADVNGDGVLSIEDVAAIIDMLLNG